MHRRLRSHLSFVSGALTNSSTWAKDRLAFLRAIDKFLQGKEEGVLGLAFVSFALGRLFLWPSLLSKKKA